MQVGIVAPSGVGKTTLIEFIALWALEKVPVYDKQGAGSFCAPQQLEATRLARCDTSSLQRATARCKLCSSICKIS